MAKATWVGIDVGGRRKGFHGAVLDEGLRLDFDEFRGDDALDAVWQWVHSLRPERVAIDSPASWAPSGHSSRPNEIEFVRQGICGIRSTPSEEVAAARTDTYYEWIEHGLELWEGFRQREAPLVECFPTASWSQWAAPRGQRRRARWTREALLNLGSRGLVGHRAAKNQDRRDAAAAALTARQFERQEMLSFGPLTVPPRGSDPLA